MSASAPAPHILTEDQRNELAAKREAFRAQIRSLHTQAAQTTGAARDVLLKHIRRLEKDIGKVNEQLRTGHTNAPSISRSLWRRIALTADAYLYAEDDTEGEAAGNLLEQLLAELGRRDPHWRHR